MKFPEGVWAGAARFAKALSAAAPVLKEVVDTERLAASVEVGAYFRNSRVEGVRGAATETRRTVFEGMTVSASVPKVTAAVFAISVPAGVAARAGSVPRRNRRTVRESSSAFP
jgi:hypothetical protein